MTIIIFGATGMVGKRLVRQALSAGHTVKAFGRNVFTENLPVSDKLILIHGTLFDEEQVKNAITGCDAVLSVIGGALNGADFARSLGMKNIVAQMKKTGTQRIIALGGIGSLKGIQEVIALGEGMTIRRNTEMKEQLIIDSKEFPKEYLEVGREHQKAYEYLKDSGLKWTFVCAPAIINDEATSKFITNADYLPEPNKFFIHSGDLALFMLQELEKNEYIQHRVGISN